MNTPDQSPSKIGLFLRALLPVCLILAGLAGGYYFKSSRPEIKRKPPVKKAQTVETITISPGRHQGTIQAMGTVRPYREVVLKSRVAGEIIFTAPGFVQGGQVRKGELLLVLEDSDYKIELDKAQSALEKALSSLAIEQGNQLIAKAELDLLKEVSDEPIASTDLALRKPQLTQAETVVKSAKADLEKAKLNLSRTRISSPFNALVVEKDVDKGAFVSAQAMLCTLVDVDVFNIEAQVPPDRLSSFQIDPQTGSRAVVYSQYSGQTLEGRAVRLTGKMTDKSRMAGVIIEVRDPLGRLGQTSQPLLLDDHVTVNIMGKVFENVYLLPRKYLRDNQTIWVYKNDKLEMRNADIAWREDGEVFVSSGIDPQDKIITTDIPAPVNGMALMESVSRRKSSGDSGGNEE